jgi:hypothetical protein
MKTHVTRASIVLTIAVMGAASAVAGCDQAQSPAAPTGHDHAVPELSDASAANGTTASLGSDLAAVRRATARFHRISEAFDAGYVLPAGEPCVAIPTGAMGYHVSNPALMKERALDPARPELLLYLRKPNGDMQLVGVEYLQAVLVQSPSSTTAEPWVSPDFANPTPWPATYTVVSPTPQLFGQSFGDYHPGHTPEMPWHWDLHAWVWTPNPDGVFAPFNPAIQCD